MTKRLPELIEKNQRFFGYAVMLPFLLALIVIGSIAIASLASSFVKHVDHGIKPDASSTLEGKVVGNGGLSISSVKSSGDGDFESQAVFQDEYSILLVTGGSSSCPINFTGITQTDGVIKLDGRAGSGKEQACTDDWGMKSFLIESPTPIDAQAVEINYSDGVTSLYLDLIQPTVEGPGIDMEGIKDNGFMLREIDPTIPTFAPDDDVYALSQTTETPAAIKSLDGKRIVFTYAGSSSCPIDFVGIELVEGELKLKSEDNNDGVCTRDYVTRVFEIVSEEPFEVESLTILPTEAPEQSINIPFVEVYFD